MGAKRAGTVESSTDEFYYENNGEKKGRTKKYYMK
jgi:hypothetical protein